MSLDFKEAMECLKSERPVYYDGVLMRKITGLIWRRDVDALVASAEVLDETTHAVSFVGLDKLEVAPDVERDVADGQDVLKAIYRMEDILSQIKSCVIYERGAGAADGYVRMMREAIKLDESIFDLQQKEADKKMVADIDAARKEIDPFIVKAENDKLAERIEQYKELEEIEEVEEESL